MRHDVRSLAALRFGIELSEMVLYDVHLGPRLIGSHFRPKSGEAYDVVVGAIRQKERIPASESCVDIRLLLVELKSRPEHANDRVIDSVQSNCLAKRRWTPRKTFPPQTIAQDDGGAVTDPVLLRRQFPTECQVHAESSEKIRRDILIEEWIESLADLMSAAYLLMHGARNILKDVLARTVQAHGPQACAWQAYRLRRPTRHKKRLHSFC
jgi:hypothetical protein